jgi:hypothetical protein
MREAKVATYSRDTSLTCEAFLPFVVLGIQRVERWSVTKTSDLLSTPSFSRFMHGAVDAFDAQILVTHTRSLYASWYCTICVVDQNLDPTQILQHQVNTLMFLVYRTPSPEH